MYVVLRLCSDALSPFLLGLLLSGCSMGAANACRTAPPAYRKSGCLIARLAPWPPYCSLLRTLYCTS